LQAIGVQPCRPTFDSDGLSWGAFESKEFQDGSLALETTKIDQPVERIPVERWASRAAVDQFTAKWYANRLPSYIPGIVDTYRTDRIGEFPGTGGLRKQAPDRRC